MGTGEGLRQRIRLGLLGEQPFPGGPSQRIAADFLVEAHDNSMPPDAQTLATAVASLLRDDDVLVRSGAVRFFQGSKANEPAALLDALNNDGGLFEGVSDPLPGGTGDLRHELARAAARRLAKDPALRDAIRVEALRPGRARTVIAALGWADRAWLRAHALDIAAANPDALDPLLYSLRSAGEDLGVLVLALRMRVPDAPLMAAIRSVFSDDGERDSLLALL